MNISAKPASPKPRKFEQEETLAKITKAITMAMSPQYASVDSEHRMPKQGQQGAGLSMPAIQV